MNDYSLFRAYAKVDLNIIRKNIESISSSLCGKAKTVAVVKADAYGHGAEQVAFAVKDIVSSFAVATPEEALLIRRIIKDKPICILGYCHPDAYADMINNDIVISIFKYTDALTLSSVAQKLGKSALVNIKVDTGMARIGVPVKDAPQFAAEIAKLPSLSLYGTLMHFSVSDSDSKEDIIFTNAQKDKFMDYIKACAENSLKFEHISLSNSAAILQMPTVCGTEVRAGILMYGYYPSEQVRRDIVKVTPALSLHSHIVQIKEIEEGDAVGYGRAFIAERKMRIATIPVGYGDGYPRLLSGIGRVLIKGKYAPIIGRICMDMFMVDVSHIPEACELCEVVLLGRQNENRIDADDIAALTGTISYEVLCDVGKRIPRIYQS